MNDFRRMNDDEIDEIILRATHERDQRYALKQIPSQMDSLNRQYMMFSGRPENVEWIKPQSAFDAYPHGWQVRFNDQTWVSLQWMNRSQPGDENNEWGVVVPEDEELPGWDKDVPYSNGALVVHHDKTWVSRSDNNSYEPGTEGWDEFDEEAEFQRMLATTPPEPMEGYNVARTRAYPSVHPVPPGMPPNPEDESPFSANF